MPNAASRISPCRRPTYDYYGADRHGANLFSDCLLALDARTGKRLWHFQMVHHDLWDYDPTAAPQLITVRKDGKRIDAVAQATKQGFVFVFDRVTGEPVWPIEERPVPKSDVPGEAAWPTQPFSTLPPSAKQVVTPEDLTPFFITRGRTSRVARAHRQGAHGVVQSAGADGIRGHPRRRGRHQLGQHRRQSRCRHHLSTEPGLPVVLQAAECSGIATWPVAQGVSVRPILRP